VREPGRERDAEQRRRRRAEEHPAGETRLDVTELAVPDRAHGLEESAVHDVGADGHGWLETEDDHEDRRHQRAAPHPGQPDERSDDETGENELPGHATEAPLAGILAVGLRSAVTSQPDLGLFVHGRDRPPYPLLCPFSIQDSIARS
jgi:hypothetical protein